MERQSMEPRADRQTMTDPIDTEPIDFAALPGAALVDTNMVTVRVSQELYDALAAEAMRVRLSINRLCKTKLAAAIDGCPLPKFLTPRQRGRMRGKPVGGRRIRHRRVRRREDPLPPDDLDRELRDREPRVRKPRVRKPIDYAELPANSSLRVGNRDAGPCPEEIERRKQEILRQRGQPVASSD